MTVKEIFDTKAEFNKWLKELTSSEVKLILDMLEEAKLEAQTFYDKEEELKKSDLKKAFDIMSENIWDWWD